MINGDIATEEIPIHVEYMQEMENPAEGYNNIVRWLVKHGYSDEEIGKVIANVVPAVTHHTLVPFMSHKVDRNATLYTDDFPSHDHMTRLGYRRLRIELQGIVT